MMIRSQDAAHIENRKRKKFVLGLWFLSSVLASPVQSLIPCTWYPEVSALESALPPKSGCPFHSHFPWPTCQSAVALPWTPLLQHMGLLAMFLITPGALAPTLDPAHIAACLPQCLSAFVQTLHD